MHIDSKREEVLMSKATTTTRISALAVGLAMLGGVGMATAASAQAAENAPQSVQAQSVKSLPKATAQKGYYRSYSCSYNFIKKKAYSAASSKKHKGLTKKEKRMSRYLSRHCMHTHVNRAWSRMSHTRWHTTKWKNASKVVHSASNMTYFW